MSFWIVPYREMGEGGREADEVGEGRVKDGREWGLGRERKGREWGRGGESESWVGMGIGDEWKGVVSYRNVLYCVLSSILFISFLLLPVQPSISRMPLAESLVLSSAGGKGGREEIERGE
jgi:hypothetical protein